MKSFQRIPYLFGLIVLFVGIFACSSHSGTANKAPENFVLSSDQLKGKIYSLAGIVDDSKSNAFACNFGRYTVSHLVERDNRKEFKLLGEGILVNSASIDGLVSANDKITYSVPKEKDIKNGTVLSVYCNGKGRPYNAPIEYFVTEK